VERGVRGKDIVVGKHVSHDSSLGSVRGASASGEVDRRTRSTPR
jgi:hypothetical protein